MNKLLLILVLMASSPVVLAHGSSHPSCTDMNTGHRYKCDDNAYAYDVCEAEWSAYRAEKYRLCTIDPSCKAEREVRELRFKIIFWSITMLVTSAFLIMLWNI